MHQNEPVMTRRQRIHFAGLLALISVAAVAVTTCASCAGAPRVLGRTTPDQHRAAVTLREQCRDFSGAVRQFSGSGVVLPDGRVLTASHVVLCEVAPGSDVYYEGEVEVDPGDGHWRSAKVAKIDTDSDVAVLDVPDLGNYATPVEVGPPPALGEVVCMATGSVPNYYLKCGTVQPGNGTSDIVFDTVTIPGNSGSALYDSLGRLVGTVVRFRGCPSLPWRQACDGVATSLWSLRGTLGI